MVNSGSTHSHINALRIHQEQAYALTKQLEKFKLTTYPSEEVSNFIDELYMISYKFVEIFNPDNRLEYTKIELYRQLLTHFQSVVAYISQTNFSQHPLELILPAKELLITFGQKTDFFTEPTWELNYAIGDIWSKLSEHLKTELTLPEIQTEKKILIRFPIIHKDDMLLGGVMGHELGHYFDLHSGLNISAELFPMLLQHQNLKKLIKYISIKHNEQMLVINTEGKLNYAENLIKLILGDYYLYPWLKEFIADICGILTYGPASHFSGESIFTFSSVSSNGKLKDQYAKTHPKKSIRSIVRKSTFTKLGYDGVMDPIIQRELDASYENWEDADHDDYIDYIDGKVNDSLIYRFEVNKDSIQLIEEILLSNLNQIIDVVIEKIPDHLHYTSENYLRRVDSLAKKIANLIPPNEDGHGPADSISILNAGWHAYFLYNELLKTEVPEATNEFNTREIINRLVKKALVSASIHRRWVDVSSN